MFATCLATLILAQEPAGTPPAAQKAEAVEAAAVEQWTDADARAALADFKQRMGGKDAGLVERVTAVEELAKGSNKYLVTPLATVVAGDKGVSVRNAAAKALGYQPVKQARPAILKLLRRSELDDFPQVQAHLVAALDRAGYESSDWDEIDDLFEKGYGEERLLLQKSLLALIANNKEKQAIDILLRNLGEPIPEDVDAATNPPAEYWEKRWKAWQVWREDVKKALFEITGQRFSTSDEAKVWLKKNGAKIGIR